MSLDNFQIPINLLPELYSNSLVLLDDKQPKSISLIRDNFDFLGGNKKNILILVNVADFVHLSDENLQFLTSVLAACKLSIADVVILNLNRLFQYDEIQLKDFFKPNTIIYFDIDFSNLDTVIPNQLYEVTTITNINYLRTQSLQVIAENIEAKKRLWNCLKMIFV
jgi:hypothetical protein